jgi:hypothetical protein
VKTILRAVADNVAPTLTVAVAVAAGGLALTAPTNGAPFWIGVGVLIVGGLAAVATL